MNVEKRCDEDEEAMIPIGVSSPYGPPSPIVIVKNHIYFYQDIDATIARALFSALHETAMSIIKNASENNVPLTPIVLHINSFGGEVSNAFGIIKCIEDIQNGTIHKIGDIPIKIPVETVIDAEADSAASLIACVGSKRYISKDGLCLLHEVRQTLSLGGKSEDIKIESENLDMYKQRMYDIYIRHSNGKLTKETIEKVCANEKYSTPQELIEYGLVDEII